MILLNGAWTSRADVKSRLDFILVFSTNRMLRRKREEEEKKRSSTGELRRVKCSRVIFLGYLATL